MARFRNKERFSINTTEEFFPVGLLTEGILQTMGIWAGGMSCLNSGSAITRQRNRPYHIIILCTSGEGRFIMEDGTEFFLKPGELFFSNAGGQGHSHLPATAQWHICWVQVLENASWLVNPPDDYSITKARYGKDIESCMSGIIRDDAIENDDYAYMQNLRCQILIQYFKREMKSTFLTGKNMAYMKAFSKLWQNVSAHISYPWNIEDLCRIMNLSRAHMIRLCQEFYGMTPTAKVHQIKMNYAHTLLRTMGYTISEVAEMIGYDSLSGFYTAFKKFYGTLPSDIS